MNGKPMNNKLQHATIKLEHWYSAPLQRVFSEFADRFSNCIQRAEMTTLAEVALPRNNGGRSSADAQSVQHMGTLSKRLK
jgi:hypothetical protein